MTQPQPQYPERYPTVPLSHYAGPQPRARKPFGRVIFPAISGVVGLGLGLMLGVAVSAAPEARSSADGSAVAEVPATAPTTEAKATRAPAPTIEDGTWTVGVDFPAGRYRVTQNVGGSCYWAIFRTGGDSVGDIIANDLPGGGRPSVTLKKGQDFKSSRCGTWRKV